MIEQATAPSGTQQDARQTLEFIPQEQAVCCSCKAQLPREHVIAQIKRSSAYTPTRQRVRAWCEHCKLMFECTRELRGGLWCLLGAVESVTDERRRREFLHRIEAQRGEVQVPKD